MRICFKNRIRTSTAQVSVTVSCLLSSLCLLLRSWYRHHSHTIKGGFDCNLWLLNNLAIGNQGRAVRPHPSKVRVKDQSASAFSYILNPCTSRICWGHFWLCLYSVSWFRLTWGAYDQTILTFLVISLWINIMNTG